MLALPGLIETGRRSAFPGREPDKFASADHEVRVQWRTGARKQIIRLRLRRHFRRIHTAFNFRQRRGVDVTWRNRQPRHWELEIYGARLARLQVYPGEADQPMWWHQDRAGRLVHEDRYDVGAGHSTGVAHGESHADGPVRTDWRRHT